jgi:hypothetical protein
LSYTLTIMKRVLLICLLSLVYFNTNAQVFGGPGSTWWIHGTNVGGMHVQKYEYVNDILIQNKLYQNIRVNGVMDGFWLTNPIVDNTTYWNVYVSNDTVAIGTPDNLTLQLAFNANIGDTWLCGGSEICYTDNIPTDTVDYYVSVEDKFDTTINNITLRAMMLLKHGCVDNYASTLVIEKIGGGNFLPINWQVIDSSIIAFYDDWQYGLKCFQSNELGFVPWGYNYTYTQCESLLPVEETISNSIIILPNPTDNFIQIKNSKAESLNYTIHNNLGQQIQSGKISDTTIDITNKPSGLYLLTIYTSTHSKSFKVVKN